MRKLKVKRNPGNVFIEPANRSTQTPCTDTQSTVLEILAEIICLIASLGVGWIAWIIF